MPPVLLNINMVKQELRIGHQRELNWGPPDLLPMVASTALSSAATEKSYDILYTNP